MSHYDEAYEHEEIERSKKYKKQISAAIDLLQDYRAKTYNLGVKPPRRFLDSLEDLENWMGARK